MNSMERTRKLMITLYIVAGLAALVGVVALGAYGVDNSAVVKDSAVVFLVALIAAIALGLIRKDVQDELRFLETQVYRDAKTKVGAKK